MLHIKHLFMDMKIPEVGKVIMIDFDYLKPALRLSLLLFYGFYGF